MKEETVMKKRYMSNSTTSKIYQVSTLQALAMGYTKKVITVGELLEHGDTGLGTFENVDGEMIVLDGHCYRALEDGRVVEADSDMGVPFSSVTKFQGILEFEINNIESIDDLKRMLTDKVDEGFGLNSMHIVRIDVEQQIKSLGDRRIATNYNSVFSILVC